jgi:CcmD family protein
MTRSLLARASAVLGLSLLAAFVTIALSVSTAEAQENEPGDRSAAFRSVTGPDAEQVPGGTLLLIAYGAVWVLMAGYLWRLGGMHRDNQKDIDHLRKSFARGATSHGAGEEA